MSFNLSDHGIGKPKHCEACERWRKKIAARREEEKMGISLNPVQQIKNETLAKVAQAVRDTKAKLDAAQKEYDEAVAVEKAIKAAWNIPVKDVVGYYGVPSRSGGRGHFVRVYGDGTSECTCEANKGGASNKCWARKFVEATRLQIFSNSSFDRKAPYYLISRGQYESKMLSRSQLPTNVWSY